MNERHLVVGLKSSPPWLRLLHCHWPCEMTLFGETQISVNRRSCHSLKNPISTISCDFFFLKNKNFSSPSLLAPWMSVPTRAVSVNARDAECFCFLRRPSDETLMRSRSSHPISHPPGGFSHVHIHIQNLRNGGKEWEGEAREMGRKVCVCVSEIWREMG